MKLDRTTYEAWLLDRIEGRLTPGQEQELNDFLSANPDLEASAGDFPTVRADETAIDWKNELRKTFPPTGAPDAARLDDFLVARMEKDLTPQQEKSLDRFMYEHPERDQDAKRIAASRADGATEPFNDKASVERHFPPQGMPDKHRLTDFLIAAQEGDLSSEQGRALKGYMQAHPEAAHEARLVAAAQVTREHVVFAGKERLKKKEGRVIALWLRYAAAASIALLLGLAWWMGRGEQVDQVADQEKVGPLAPANTNAGANATNQGTDPAGTQQAKDGSGLRPVPHTAPDGGAVDSTDRDRREGAPVAPAPQPIRIEEPASVPEPQLAHAPEPSRVEPTPDPVVIPENTPVAQQEPGQQPAPQVVPLVAAVDRSAEGGTPVGTVLANAVRGSVIESGKRDASLDGDDALALVNKGLGSITGGQGRVQVDSKGDRDRWKLRLGRHFAISASTGR